MKPATIRDILSRRSTPQIGGRGPDEGYLDWILQAAMSANDHGRLRPWEFRVFAGKGRAALAGAFLRHALDLGGLERERERTKALPAPVVVCVSTSVKNCRIPRRDQ